MEHCNPFKIKCISQNKHFDVDHTVVAFLFYMFEVDIVLPQAHCASFNLKEVKVHKVTFFAFI